MTTGKLKKAIGAVKDHTSIGIAKVSSNISSNLEVAVLRATTHDDLPIDDRYALEVLQIVSSNKIHAAACARAVGKRIGRTRNWIVALKSLMLVLRIFQDGDPYFPREVLHAMKRGSKILNLSGFRDDSNSSPWDFTSFVRTFALYLDERLECFLTGKLQRRYAHHDGSPLIYQRSKSRGAAAITEPVRDMKPAMLLDKMTCWQRLIDRAIATRPTGAARANNLILLSLHAVVRETFDLYRDISDGLAQVLDIFFHLQYQNGVAAFQICLKAVKQFDELSGFYTMCRGLGVGRSSEYPTVQSISDELIESLQEFLKDHHQSSFPSDAAKSVKTLESDCGSDGRSPATASEFGPSSQCTTSLEELISATETWTGPAISIDLEAYSESPREEDPFGMSEKGSSRSLPVSSSVADLISLGDWTEQKDQQLEQPPLESSLQARQKSDPSTNGDGLPENAGENPWEIELYKAATNNPPESEDRPSAAVNESSSSSTGWDLVLFEAPPPPATEEKLPIPSYNPFLTEPSVNHQLSSSFDSVPTFSVESQTQSSFPARNDDPFACDPKMFSSPIDQQQNLLLQQQLWLQNQNKIIAKHLTQT
ncbi:hypothetical protein M569_03549 [Genlisea aurea]|uniref:ENTH domain-containing protein n=1 Tax=Genlisea aurea TaxID=192259 RepID=S8E5X9_9LAMI|nr:hypothetical protein M569_03549 [Genlisea aurea]